MSSSFSSGAQSEPNMFPGFSPLQSLPNTFPKSPFVPDSLEEAHEACTPAFECSAGRCNATGLPAFFLSCATTCRTAHPGLAGIAYVCFSSLRPPNQRAGWLLGPKCLEPKWLWNIVTGALWDDHLVPCDRPLVRRVISAITPAIPGISRRSRLANRAPV